MSRAERRRRTAIHRKKVVKNLVSRGWSEENAHKNAEHAACCSCEICGNVRRNPWLSDKEKKTRQELLRDDIGA